MHWGLLPRVLTALSARPAIKGRDGRECLGDSRKWYTWGSMGASQLPLFQRKTYKGIIPGISMEIQAPAGDRTVLQTLPAYYTYLKDGGYSQYTPDDFTGDVKKFGVFLKEKLIILLACALGGKCDYLITGDEDLLVLNGKEEVGKLQIIKVGAFLHRKE
jgi:hypothetical protein